MIILRNCRFVKELVEGYNEEYGDILIENDIISDIKPCGTNFGVNTCEIDVKNKTVMPGLFDLHIHLSLSGGDTLIDNAKSPVEHAYSAVKHAQDSLYSGFTTLRDAGCNDNIAIKLRDSIEKGELIGPNIIASGQIITPTEAGNDFFAGLYVEADEENEIKKAVRGEMKKGADFIKIMATGAVMNPGGEPGEPIYTYNEMKALVEIAEFKNTYVAAHCHGTVAIKDAIKAGIRTIEHASMLDNECIEMLKEETSFIVPTISIMTGLVQSLPESSTFMIEKAKTVLECIRLGVGKAYKEGLKIGFATDSGGTPIVHGINGNEFLHRKEIFNMSNRDLLKQATIDSAIIAGVDDTLGSLKVGKIADIIVVNGDPLKDISVMIDHIDIVIKSGKIVKK